jgi:tRNA dimethylallyltransferase
MLRDGLVEELASLKKRFELSSDLPSMRAVGYRQVWRFFEGEINEAEMRSQALAATRQLAKRQMTWLRKLPGLAPAQALEAALTRA